MRRAAWIVPLLAALVAACGGSSPGAATPTPTSTPTPAATATPSPEPPPVRRGEPTREEVATVRGWADALRAGRVREANGFFALPATVSNGGGPVELRNEEAVDVFNRSLPCGAKVLGIERSAHSFVIATFRLTERPGPGSCGTGTGGRAATAFLVEDGRIVQWRRVGDPADAIEGDEA